MTEKKDTPLGTFVVAAVVCLVCSIFVAGAAVGLKPKQTANKLTDLKLNILDVAGLYEPGMDVDKAFKRFEARILDIGTGQYADDINVDTYDMRKATKDPALSRKLSPSEDLADIKRKPKYAKIYLVRDEQGKVDTVILPVNGYGLWSTLYGFLAVEEDGNTVVGLKFYEHAETPGLGGEVDNPKRRAQWVGKEIYGPEGEARLGMQKGGITPGTEAAQYKVDAIGGATLTSNGVSNLLQYWLGPEGYKTYLERYQTGEFGS